MNEYSAVVFGFWVLQLGLGIYGSVIDLRTQRLPNQLTLAIAVLGLPHWWNSNWAGWPQWLALNVVVIGLVIMPASGFGAGDWKLIAGLSPSLLASNTLWIWLWSACVCLLIAAAISGRLHLQAKFPFGPHLVGTWALFSVGQFAPCCVG